jgi:cell division protein FtsB
MPEDQAVNRMEGRWIAFLTAIALAFGGIWLQNQYEATLRLQEDVSNFMRHVDDKYVQKDYLDTLVDRLRRIEDKLDDVRDEMGRSTVPSRTTNPYPTREGHP